MYLTVGTKVRRHRYKKVAFGSDLPNEPTQTVVRIDGNGHVDDTVVLSHDGSWSRGYINLCFTMVSVVQVGGE